MWSKAHVKLNLVTKEKIKLKSLFFCCFVAFLCNPTPQIQMERTQHKQKHKKKLKIDDCLCVNSNQQYELNVAADSIVLTVTMKPAV